MYNVHTARTFVHTNVIWSLELAESVHDKPLVSWKYKTGAIRTETFKIISESLNSIFYFFFFANKIIFFILTVIFLFSQ